MQASLSPETLVTECATDADASYAQPLRVCNLRGVAIAAAGLDCTGNHLKELPFDTKRHGDHIEAFDAGAQLG